MSERIPVYVYANDPLSQAGVAAQLRGRPEIWVVEESQIDDVAVAVIVTDTVDEDSLRVTRAIQRNGVPRVVLVVTHIDETGLLASVEAGACGVVRRADAVPERLVAAVRSALAGDGTVPPDLLGRLLDQVGRLQRQILAPRGITLSGLSDREVSVLRLAADGLDTGEIAGQLCYSERTVKNVIHDVTNRLHLRNRTHAVAYALREGLI